MPPPINSASAPPPGTKFILIALGLGLLAIIINVVWANSVVQSARETAFEVVTINRTVYGNKDTLQEGDISVLPIPSKFAEVFQKIGALTKQEALAYAQQRRPFFRTVLQNDILRHSAFDPKDAQGTYRPPDAGKAFKAIVVNDVRQPAGLHPGSFVDIIGTFSSATTPPKAYVVKEHVELVGIGSVTQEESAAGRQPTHYRTVTIEVPAAERTTWIDIEHLAMGQYFDLMERNPTDGTYKADINPEVILLLSRNANSTDLTPGRTRFRP